MHHQGTKDTKGLFDVALPFGTEAAAALAKRLEAFETPVWAVEALLAVEGDLIGSGPVWDPCCGTGSISGTLRRHGIPVIATDIHPWGGQDRCEDFFDAAAAAAPIIVMNPPFSRACAFVDAALALGIRTIVSFQRYSWRLTQTRRAWWRSTPLSREWACGDRASCWRADIPLADRKGGTPTDHSWFLWDPAAPPVEPGAHVTRVLYRADAAR